MQKGLLQQHSLTQSCQLRNPRAGGISARTFLPQGLRCSHSGGRQALTLGLCLKVGGCLLTDPIIDCLLPEFPPCPDCNCCPRDDGWSCQPLIYFNCHLPFPLAMERHRAGVLELEALGASGCYYYYCFEVVWVGASSFPVCLVKEKVPLKIHGLGTWGPSPRSPCEGAELCKLLISSSLCGCLCKRLRSTVCCRLHPCFPPHQDSGERA